MKKLLTFVSILITILLSFLIPKLASADDQKVDGKVFDIGLSRVVLKENMVKGVNTLTQEMMPVSSGDNTIYVIKNDFELSENILIPNNSVLLFDGGSIIARNRTTITGQNTTIQAGLVRILGTNVALSGKWNVDYGYPEWFGATGDGIQDDTDAFYSALSNFDSIFLSGLYSIDFKDIKLSEKAIVGKWKNRSGIVQRNKNIPFALVGTYNLLNGFTIKAYNNTQVTDVLHFGYSNGSYNAFSFTDIKDVDIAGSQNTSGDAKIIPFHFNMKNGGNSDCMIENVRISHCYIGIWYEFHKESSPFGWITQCTMKDVTIYNPSNYGFKWDALSMYGQSTMWCYNNYFENISIDIIKDKATGFYIGQGMGMLVNPMVFNDIPAKQPDAVGYSVEFAPIGSPVRPKMVTNIIGGSFEGQIKNMEYAYMNNISNLKISYRNNRGSTDSFVTLNSGTIPDAYDFNIFGKDILNNFAVKNATLSVGSDEFGEYLKVTKIDPKIEAYFGGGVDKQLLSNNGVKNGLYTLQTIARSNLGNKGTGFYFTPSKYRYEIDGKSGENVVLGKDLPCIGNSVFVNITENVSDKFVFGYYSKANSDYEWIKIYGIRLLPGIVGKYQMENFGNPRKENINISRDFTVGSESIRCSASFTSIKEVTNKSLPISVQCVGTVPPGDSGTVVTIGKLPCYSVPNKIWFLTYDSDSGTVVGMCSVENDGTFKFIYTTKIRKKTNFFGSA